MISEDERKKLMMETVGHVRQLKEKLNDLRCDTPSSERTLSLILEDNSGMLDEKVERDLARIDNLLGDVASKLKLRDLLGRKVPNRYFFSFKFLSSPINLFSPFNNSKKNIFRIPTTTFQGSISETQTSPDLELTTSQNHSSVSYHS